MTAPGEKVSVEVTIWWSVAFKQWRDLDTSADHSRVTVSRVAGVAFGALLALTACTSTTNAAKRGESFPPSPADSLCYQALPGVRLGDAMLTTVESMRKVRGGPNHSLVLARLFPSVSGTTKAAWCWTYDGPEGGSQKWSGYAVASGQPARRVMQYTGDFSPQGAPKIP